MRDKIIGLEQAAKLVRDGDQVIMMGGMDFTPMALLREMVRARIKGLRTVGVVGGAINLDFLVGAGATASVETCDLNLQPFARVGPNFMRYVKAGRVKSRDNT